MKWRAVCQAKFSKKSEKKSGDSHLISAMENRGQETHFLMLSRFKGKNLA